MVLGGLFASLAWSGCDSKSNKHKISPSLFLAPITDRTSPDSVRVLGGRVPILQEITPSKLPSELADTPLDASVLGRLSIREVEVDPATQQEVETVSLSDSLLLYESLSRSIVSVNMCTDAKDPNCGRVRLHYNTDGILSEQDEQGSIAANVQPVKLKNGWIVAFDSSTKNIVAFREEKARKGLEFRQAPVINGRADFSNENFGRGNGVVFSVVISGEDLADQLDLNTVEPIVSRFFEVEANKLLLFFPASSFVTGVHLLELREEEVDLDFNLHPFGSLPSPAETFKVKQLRGEIKLPGQEPFLDLKTVQPIVGSINLSIDDFPPVTIPDPAHPEPAVMLLHETVTSTFLKVAVVKEQGEIVGSAVGIAIPRATVVEVLQQGAGAAVVDPPFEFTRGFHSEDPDSTEIFLVEEKTNNILAYDYTGPFGNNLRIFVPSVNLILPRSPSGKIAEEVASEPNLAIATGDVRQNRLAFEDGLDQLVSLSYTSGVVVTVADRQAISDRTGDPLANFTYIEPLGEHEIRAFDAQSAYVVAIRLEYAALPIRLD